MSNNNLSSFNTHWLSFSSLPTPSSILSSSMGCQKGKYCMLSCFIALLALPICPLFLISWSCIPQIFQFPLKCSMFVLPDLHYFVALYCHIKITSSSYSTCFSRGGLKRHWKIYPLCSISFSDMGPEWYRWRRSSRQRRICSGKLAWGLVRGFIHMYKGSLQDHTCSISPHFENLS